MENVQCLCYTSNFPWQGGQFPRKTTLCLVVCMSSLVDVMLWFYIFFVIMEMLIVYGHVQFIQTLQKVSLSVLCSPFPAPKTSRSSNKTTSVRSMFFRFGRLIGIRFASQGAWKTYWKRYDIGWMWYGWLNLLFFWYFFPARTPEIAIG